MSDQPKENGWSKNSNWVTLHKRKGVETTQRSRGHKAIKRLGSWRTRGTLTAGNHPSKRNSRGDGLGKNSGKTKKGLEGTDRAQC